MRNQIADKNNEMRELDPQNIPRHVAIIMDGNGRWAKQQGKMRIFGHKNGVSAVRKAVTYARETGISHLTLYAFSRENWNRPAQEVSALMTLFMQALDLEVKKLHKHNIKLNILGDLSAFNPTLQQKIQAAQELTQHNDALVLNIAANYSGQWDILQAAKQLANHAAEKQIDLDDINIEDFQSYLVTAHQPPVDLLIRTSGEQRISNFLLWQIAYAEFYFTEVMWPDFDEQTFHQAVLAYQQRHRRFGASE